MVEPIDFLRDSIFLFFYVSLRNIYNGVKFDFFKLKDIISLRVDS